MRLMGEKNERKSRCGVTIWDREGKTTKDGKKSITFTVEETTMEELADYFKQCVRNYEKIIKMLPKITE
jgi:hypothetical protein